MVVCSSSSADWAASLTSKLFEMSDSDDGTLSNVLIEEILVSKANQSDCQRLASELLRVATMTHTPETRMFDCLEMLAGADSDYQILSSTTMLEVCTEFTDFYKTRCLCEVLSTIQQHRDRIGCSFGQFKECEELACAVVNLFKWFIASLEFLISFDNDSETSLAITTTLTTAQQYIDDPFVFKLLHLVGKCDNIADGPDSLRLEIVEPLLQWKNSPISSFREIGELHNSFIKIFQPLESLEQDYILKLVQKLRRPGIRSVTSVLVSFRVLMPVKEAAETIMTFARIHGFSTDTLLLDLLHASLLIMIEENENRNGKHHSVMFFFAKLPKILEYFLVKEFVSQETIQDSLFVIVDKYRQELDTADFALKENSIKTLVCELCKLGIIKEDCAQNLQMIRIEQIKPNIELHQTIIKHENTKDKQVAMILSMNQLKNSLEKALDNSERFSIMFPKIIASGFTLFDSFCSSYCINGDLSDLTRRIATMLRNGEKQSDPSLVRDNLRMFTITFSLLARVAFNFPSMSVEELVAGKDGVDSVNMQSSFYKWSKKMVKRIVPVKTNDPADQESTSDVADEKPLNGPSNSSEDEDTRLDTNESSASKPDNNTSEEPAVANNSIISESMRANCLNLAQRQGFWDFTRMSFYEILELIPSIGAVWLQEFKNERKSADKSKAEFKNIIFSFSDLPVMLLCLAQWLESEPQSQQRYLMARCILDVMEDCSPDQNGVCDKNVWSFVRSVVRLHLEEVRASSPSFHPMSIYLKSIANRTLPYCQRLQIPDMNILRDGWIYAQRQNWFNQRTLMLIDHMNKAKLHRSWIKLLINNMMKLETQDHMGKAIELICSTLLLDPVRSIIVALEILFDFLLSRDGTGDPQKPGLQHQSEYAIPLVKLVVHILLMGVWTVDMKKFQEGPDDPVEKRAKLDPEAAVFGELEEGDRVDTLHKTIINCVNCMIKASMHAVYTPSTSMVFHILNMIAKSPESRSKSLLMQMIPHEMLFRMALLDPRMMTLEVFSRFCDPSKSEHDQEQLQFLCLLRRSGGL